MSQKKFSNYWEEFFFLKSDEGQRYMGKQILELTEMYKQIRELTEKNNQLSPEIIELEKYFINSEENLSSSKKRKRNEPNKPR